MFAKLTAALKSGIDPKWIVVLAWLVGIQKGIGQGAISLTNMIPDSWIPHVIAWNNGLAWLGVGLMGLFAALSSSASGPLIPNISLPLIDVAKAAAKVLLIAFALSFLLANGSAHAQAKKPSSGPQTLTSYTQGTKQVLKIPNPLGLPDPMCVTDHPADSCSGTNATMSGNPVQDLTTIIKGGGVPLIRDMKRADAYLSMPLVAGCVATAAAPCTKVDQLTATCLEGIIPLAEMILNGPPAPAAVPPAATTDTKAPTTTSSPAITATDEGIVTGAAKLDIVFVTLAGDPLKQACGGWIAAKVQQGVQFQAAIVQFITTLGVAAAAL